MNEPHPQLPQADQAISHPVNAPLARYHRAEAAVNRQEADRLYSPRPDVRLSSEAIELQQQVSVALSALADARVRLADSLTGRPAEPDRSSEG